MCVCVCGVHARGEERRSEGGEREGLGSVVFHLTMQGCQLITTMLNTIVVV